MRSFIYVFIFVPLGLFAQQDAYLTLYQNQFSQINPAYAGSQAQHSFAINTRSQWGSVEGAPETLAFSYSSARGKNVGLGISVITDKVFVENQTLMTVDFSYRLLLSNASKLYLGIKAGGNSYRADPMNLYNPGSQADPAKNALSRFNPNIGIGGYFQRENLWISFSIPRMFNVKRDNDTAVFARDRVHSYLGAGMKIQLNQQFSLQPSFMLRRVNGLPIVADLMAGVSYADKFELGVSQRTRSSFSIYTSIDILDGFQMSYAFGTPTAQMLSGLGFKTHEIALRFNINSTTETSAQPDEQSEETE